MVVEIWSSEDIAMGDLGGASWSLGSLVPEEAVDDDADAVLVSLS